MMQYRIYVKDLAKAQQALMNEGIESKIQGTYLATKYEAEKRWN